MWNSYKVIKAFQIKYEKNKKAYVSYIFKEQDC